ncbi:MAG: hypothetical protein IPI67_07125 [Myxococcales bacterium]|nr:hypothetical protein [Myxococcales bacterium]
MQRMLRIVSRSAQVIQKDALKPPQSWETMDSMPDAKPCVCANHGAFLQHGLVQDSPELAATLELLPPSSAANRFECRHCGQRWEEHPTSFHHADVSALMKVSEWSERTYDPHRDVPGAPLRKA